MIGLEKDFNLWKRKTLKSIQELFDITNVNNNYSEPQVDESEDIVNNNNDGDIIDVEDMGRVLVEDKNNNNNEMVTPLIRQSLTKQGEYLFIVKY